MALDFSVLYSILLYYTLVLKFLTYCIIRCWTMEYASPSTKKLIFALLTFYRAQGMNKILRHHYRMILHSQEPKEALITCNNCNY
jgi:hypothetical protein